MRQYSYRVWFGDQSETVYTNGRSNAIILAQAERIRAGKFPAWDRVEWRPPAPSSCGQDSDWEEC